MEITTNDDATTRPATPLWLRLVSSALVAAVYFSGLTVPFMGPDEPRYAQVAREMYERGDWLTPTLGGHVWFEKPPLLYWLEIASYHAFGVNEFAARLGPALCGLGTVVALAILAKAEDRASGGWLALMTASTLGLIAFSHAADCDIILTFTLTASLAGFFTAQRSTERSGRAVFPLICFYAFTGLAILAKGLIGLIFPIAIIALFFLFSRRAPQRTILLSLLWGVPLLLVIAAPWHLAMYMRYGGEFVDVYFIQHHFERFATNRYLHPQPVYFFWWVMPLLALPWTPFAIGATVKALRERKSLVFTPSPLLIFSVCWLIVPLVFFSLSGSKLPGYILPAVPSIVVIAWIWLRAMAPHKWLTATGTICLLTLTVSFVIIVACLPWYAARDSVKDLVTTADARGYSTSRVLTLHMVSYNAEFYAGDRLLRDAEGKQVMLEGAQLVGDEINNDGRAVLVLVPIEYASQLTDYSKVDAEILGDNGHIAIVAVSAR